jgi:formylmethanofuran dehydrogenase subunit E
MFNNQLFPEDFQKCARFHGHVCPGLAIGYAAAKAAAYILKLGRAEDEEVVAVVENDSCAVDAIQMLLGCTFGKGNLIFRDWGKQVFTIFERRSERAVRLSLTVSKMPGSDERRTLKEKINAGQATLEEKERWMQLRDKAVMDFIEANPKDIFKIKEIQADPPPFARIVATAPCTVCGEETVIARLVQTDQGKICMSCNIELS